MPRDQRPPGSLSALGAVPVVFGSEFEPLDLDDGVWELRVSATDFVLNATSAASGRFEILHDIQPPRTALGIGVPSMAAGTLPAEIAVMAFISSRTLLNLNSVDDLVAADDSAGLGVALQYIEVDGLFRSSIANQNPFPDQIFSSSFTLEGDADGVYALAYYAQDTLGNREALKTSTVAVDNTAPITQLALQGGKQASGLDASSFYVSSDTRLNLPAFDPLTGGVASGLEITRYRDNQGALQDFSAPIAFGEGAHRLVYQSRDRLENSEVLRSTTVLVDATHPITTAAMGSPAFTAPDGAHYITPVTPLNFSALDPESSGVASGVERIETGVDGNEYSTYISTLTFGEGLHSVRYRAFDRVANAEPDWLIELRSDGTAPITALEVRGTYYTTAAPEGTRNYAPAHFTYALAAQDPIAQGVASGLAKTSYRIDSGPGRDYGEAFNLAEGLRRIDFWSEDRVQNTELVKSTTVYVDATAPRSSLEIGAPQTLSGSLSVVSGKTALIVRSTDPVSSDVASGIQAILFLRDLEAFAVQGGTFGLTGSDGIKTVAFYAKDNVGNARRKPGK